MSNLTPQTFVDRYGRYFNIKRVQGIQGLGFLFVEGPAEGVWFQDTAGNRFLDMWCMGGTFSLGHRNPAVMAAAERALREEEFGSLFFFSEAKGELAAKLAECTPEGLETTHPVVTGAEAIDLSIKLARGSTGRTEILHGDHAYHGCTGFALSMMARGEMRDYAEPLIPDFVELTYGDIDDLAARISDKTAAVVLEPVRTDYDGACPASDYFTRARELCDQHGAKLIIDEVVCGMGRLGTLWGSQYQNVAPDMLVTAKGFSGGVYPMAALITRPQCLDFFGESPFRTISSFAWSNVGARISHEALCETERCLPHANEMGDRLERGLSTLADRYKGPLRGIRRSGLIFAIDFENDAAGFMFIAQMFGQGVLVVASSQNMKTPKLYPPLVVNAEEVDLLLEKMEAVLRSICGG